MAEPILVAKGEHELLLLPQMANRHGLIAGATGTGKTVTLQVSRRALQPIGVPVFIADVKGDLSGIAMPGGNLPKVDRARQAARLEDFELRRLCPVTFWDVFGEQGHPGARDHLRDGAAAPGPPAQPERHAGRRARRWSSRWRTTTACCCSISRTCARCSQYVGENARTFTTQYGNVSAASVGAIQRGLLALEQQGGEQVLRRAGAGPRRPDADRRAGRGVVNILAADKLMQSPQLYATFLLWLLSELFERLPEVGDPEKPKLVFFFDEAHLLFDDAPQALQEKIEQVVRLIRSKGVGVYFVTQNPLDVPDTCSASSAIACSTRLRAFTPRDQKAVKAAAETFRAESEARRGEGDQRAGRGRGAGLVARRQGRARAWSSARWSARRAARSGRSRRTSARRSSSSSVLYGHYEQAWIASRLMRSCAAVRKPRPRPRLRRPKRERACRRSARPACSRTCSSAPRARVAGIATGWCRRLPRARPARSAASSAGRSCAGCSARSSAESGSGFSLSVPRRGRYERIRAPLVGPQSL